MIHDGQQRRSDRDQRRGRLGPGRQGDLVREVADVIRLAFEAGAIGSLWGLEGPLRASIRGELCLQGWTWETADLAARDVLAAAHRNVGAKRPTWNEGQREWVVAEGLLIERTRCVRCHKPLPEGHHKFCNELCARAYIKRVSRRRLSNETSAIRMAVRSLS
jgi:hypothetical protein